MPTRWLLPIALMSLLLVSPARAEDEPSPAPAPWFTNVAADVGLGAAKAKGCCFVDLNGDGWWDLCLDRRHFFLWDPKTKRYVVHTDHGIPFPKVRKVPVGPDGKPDEAKAKDVEYVPHYLYFADLDGDGDQDALYGVKAWWWHFDGTAWRRVEGCDPGLRSAVFLNDGKGRFSRGPNSAYPAKHVDGPAMALAIVDVDGDGRLDLFEGREYRQYGVLHGCGVDRLWIGAAGSFFDMTEAAGLTTSPVPGGPASSRPTYGVTACDWNNDGLPDLLALSYGRQWNRLWRSDGTRFVDVGMETGFAGDDITHGRYPEWVNEIMKQRGRPPRTDERPFRSNGNTFDCAVGDIDNDGDLDLFLGEIAHAWAGASSDLPSLLINRGEKGGWAFERKTVREFLPPRAFRSGDRWNYGDLHVALADFDCDTRLDLLIGSGDYPDGQFLRLYRQTAAGTFEEVAGFDWEGCGALSIGDYDRDGDVDILAGRSFMRLNQAHRDKHMGGLTTNLVGLFRNDVVNRNGNRWLNVRLVGKGPPEGANRFGIGARITVTAATGKQIRELRCGAGLANHQDPPEACFGLGRATRVERLEVRWPHRNGATQVFENLDVDRFVEVTEGKKELRIEKVSSD